MNIEKYYFECCICGESGNSPEKYFYFNDIFFCDNFRDGVVCNGCMNNMYNMNIEYTSYKKIIDYDIFEKHSDVSRGVARIAKNDKLKTLKEIKEEKYKPSLIHESFIEEVAKVRQYGVEKYKDKESWKDYDINCYLDAALRHLGKVKNGLSSIDDESGFLHLSHAACNIMFLIESIKKE